MSDSTDSHIEHRRGRVVGVIGFDVRPLAVWRILVAVLLLVEFACRAYFLTAWSRTQGAMPPETVRAFNAGPCCKTEVN